MPTEAQPAPEQRGSFIRNPQDFYGGLVLVAVALIALWASRTLPGMRGFAFGPGTAPRLFAYLLAGCGAIIMLIGFFTKGPALERYAIRGPLFVTASILIFASTIRPLGLVIACFTTIMTAAAASSEVRWGESLLVAIALTLFCSVLFPYGLNLPLQLWPRF